MSVVCLILIELSPYERCCIEISGWCKAVLQLLSSGHLLGVAVALLSFDAKGYSVGCAAAARSNFKVLKVLLLGSQVGLLVAGALNLSSLYLSSLMRTNLQMAHKGCCALWLWRLG